MNKIIYKISFLFILFFLLLTFKRDSFIFANYNCPPGQHCAAGGASDSYYRCLSNGGCWGPFYWSVSDCGGPATATCNGDFVYGVRNTCSYSICQPYIPDYWGYQIGCCIPGDPVSGCTPSCSTPACTVTDAMCASANGNNTSYDVYSALQGAAYCRGNNATCSVSDGCTGTCTDTKYCYRAATCLTNCSLPSCNADETTIATPTPRPAGCAPRTVSCENLTDCGVDNNCADSTRSCYPIGACQNCTPATPSGYHIPAVGETTNSLPECTTTNTCNKTNLCRQDVCGTVTNSFYRDERNTTDPASPTNPIMTIDGINFNLTSSQRVKKPLPTTFENTVSFSITGITVNPMTTYGPYYDYNAENKGILINGNFEWLDDYNDCDGLANEDFCFFRNTNTSIDFHGTYANHMTPTAILKEGAEGTIAFRSVSTDRCTSVSRYSAWTFPNYKVNNLPRVTDVLISGIDNYRGCQATASFTGLNANNPLTITIKGTDADDPANTLGEINGAIIWLVKDGTSIDSDINKLTYITATPPSTDGNKIGIFAKRSNSNKWVAHIVSGSLSSWGLSVDSSVKATDGRVIIPTITVSDVGGSGSELGKHIFTFTLEFPDSATSNPFLITGKYNVYAALTDLYTYRTYIDQQNVVYSNKDWNFDFVKPSVGIVSRDFSDQRNVTVTWQNSDVGSSPKSNVLNIYKDINPRHPVTPGDIIPIPVPNPITTIGDISPLLSGWYFSSPTASATINTGQNSSGNIFFYPTVYDQACNRNDSSPAPALELNKWIATKGGIFFSQSDVTYIPKQIPSFDYNLGTELITLNTGNHPEVLVLEAIKKPITAISVNDTNFTGKGNLFEVLLDRANFYAKKNDYKLLNLPLPFSQCLTDQICVWRGGNMTIGTDGTTTTYSGKILVISTGDITIYPNIKAVDPTKDGLIILSARNITIEGNNTSTALLLNTDEIDALLLANRAISIPVGTDTDLDLQQDAVKITGSMLALGVDDPVPDRAFDLQRNLGLKNPSHPVLIINYHPKYTKISELFFGTDNKIYKQEVGYKL